MLTELEARELRLRIKEDYGFYSEQNEDGTFVEDWTGEDLEIKLENEARIKELLEKMRNPEVDV